jgi:hypothetical protein
MKLDQVVFRIEMDVRNRPDLLELRVRGGSGQRSQRQVFDITDDSPPVWRLKMCGGS